MDINEPQGPHCLWNRDYGNQPGQIAVFQTTVCGNYAFVLLWILYVVQNLGMFQDPYA